MKFKSCSYAVIFLISFFVSLRVYSHEVEESVDPIEKVQEYGTLLERLAALEVSSTEVKPAVPYVKILGKKYYLNTHFFALTEELARLYIEEIKGACPECRVPTKEMINAEVKELVANGWLKHVGGTAARSVAIRYGSEFIDLGARYGTMAGLLKVAGELAEDALLVIFKMPGAHFLCEVITLGISYYSGNILTIFRTWQRAGHFGKNSTMQLVRMAATSWVVKRALKRIQLEIGPVEIHPELVDIEEKEIRSERREWLAHELTEEKRLERFLERVQKKVAENYELISKLEIERANASESRVRSINRQIESIRKKISSFTGVKRKVFEARRIGVTLWIFKRSRAMTLYSGEPELNRYFRGSKMWMLPLTSSITNPGLQAMDGQTIEMENFRTLVESQKQTLNDSDINRLLLGEAREYGMDTLELEKLFADTESLFNTKETRRSRYLRLMMMEGFFGEALPKIVRSYINNIRTELTENDLSLDQLKRVVRLQWRAGKLFYLTNMYLDYLRSATMVRGKSNILFEKDLAKDYLTQILRSMATLSELKEMPSLNEIDNTSERLKEQLELLTARRFWIEKRATFRLIPIRSTIMTLTGLGRFTNTVRKRPACSRLYY